MLSLILQKTLIKKKNFLKRFLKGGSNYRESPLDVRIGLFEDVHTIRISATTLGEVNTISNPVTVQSSPGKPWVLAFMWIALTCTTHPDIVADKTQAFPAWQLHHQKVTCPLFPRNCS